MTGYTTDNVRVLSVEAAKHPISSIGDCLKIRIALISPNAALGDDILLETTRYVDRKSYDEGDAIRMARHWFLKLCELGVETMEPFRLSDEQIATITNTAK